VRRVGDQVRDRANGQLCARTFEAAVFADVLDAQE
jgi:hypothetical protein